MHKIIKAKYFKKYTIQVFFDDDSIKYFDMSPYINDWISFIPLQDEDVFKMFSIKWNTVSWITWADVSPDFIYDNATSKIKQ